VAGLAEGRYGAFFFGQQAGQNVSADGTIDVPAKGTVQLTLSAHGGG
jgi:hypothetical protein